MFAKASNGNARNFELTAAKSEAVPQVSVDCLLLYATSDARG